MGGHEFHQMQDTSLVAHENMKKKIGLRQISVLKEINRQTVFFEGVTDWEVARGVGYLERNKVSPRRKELVEMKKIQSVGVRNCKITGRKAIIWKLTKFGEIEIEKFNKRT